jgi:1-deoxyxylulose-5-phosphate synthase
MRRNRLGRSELLVSEIGFGCMSLSSSHEENARLLHEAVELGVNLFDTADLYGRGAGEITVGKAFKGMRDRVIIATKVGNRWEEGQEGWRWDPSKAYIKKAVHDSLRRLETDYIDLYQLHGGTLHDSIDETITAFEELKREGLIRYYGISSIRPSVIREWVKRANSNIASVMLQYSLLDRRPEEAVLKMLLADNVGVIVRGPVAKGWLAGRVREGDYLDYSHGELVDVVEKLRPWASEQRSLSQLALRYALSHPAVTTVIPGASTVEQLRENAGAANVTSLGEDELAALRCTAKRKGPEKRGKRGRHTERAASFLSTLPGDMKHGAAI